MSTARPRIAVTGPDRGGFPAWAFTALAVWRAGGRPLRWCPGKFPEKGQLPGIEGLIIGGGADIEPERAGISMKEILQPTPQKKAKKRRWLSSMIAPLLLLVRKLFALKHTGPDEARDAFEEGCLRQAFANGLPILGICRGAQLINVHFGGTLHPELIGFYGEEGNPDSVYPRKEVFIASGSSLASVLQTESLMVNSFHRQAVNQLGKGIRAVARDRSEVVQAIELEGPRFVIGVQWHPEYLPAYGRHQRLFRQLVMAARKTG